MVGVTKKLEINQTWSKLGLQETPPQIKLESKAADFKLKQLPTTLEIKSEAAKVEIDMTELRYQLNHKKHKIYSKDIAQNGHQVALQAIAQYVSEGNQLADQTGNKAATVISQAKKRLNNKEREIGLKWKVGPEIKAQPAKQEINIEANDVDGIELDTKANFTKVDFQWGKLKVYQEQLPKVDIRAVDIKA